MPYKDRGKWRGVVTISGKKVAQRLYRTKREATVWENETKAAYLERTRTGSLVEVVNDYLSFAEIKFIKSTYKTKRRHLKRFIAKVLPDTLLFDITSKDVWDYLKDIKPASNFNRSRKELMTFFNYAIKFHELNMNPLLKIDPLSNDDSQPQAVFTEEEFMRIMVAADRHGRNLLVVYGTTGARRCELFKLTWTDDINFEKRTIRLGTKKSRGGSMIYRFVPMNDLAFRSLQDQWKTKLPLSDYVFQNREPNHSHYGDRYTTRRRFIPGLCKKVGIKKDRVGFHAIRRMFASLLSDKHKRSLPTIQKLLGHQHLTTTEKYIFKVQDDIKAAVEDLSFGTSLPLALPLKDQGANHD